MNKRTKMLASALLATALLGGTALAASGDEKDPLVTLSYLQQTVIPDVIRQVEEKMGVRQTELSKNLADQITQYKKDVAEQGGGGAGDSASYTLVTLTSGQTMALEVGCEVMLRVGSATVSCGENPALIDISTGGNLNRGSALTKNHLYMATMADRTITPTAATVKLLVRGGYSIK